MKWLNIFLGLLFIPLFAVLFGGSYANAANDYDDLIQLTDNLELVNIDDPNNESKNVDLTMIWYTESLEALNLRCDVEGGSWCNRYNFWRDFDFAEDHFMVIKNPANTSIQILATDDPNANLTFSEHEPGINRLVPNVDSGYTTMRIYVQVSEYSGYDTIKTENNVVITGTSSSGTYITRDDDPWLIFLSTLNLITPPGYEGEIPPETYQPPVERDEGFIRYDLSFNYEVSMVEGIKVVNTTPTELTENLGAMWRCYFIMSKSDDLDNGIEEDIYHLNSCDDRTEIIYHPPVEVDEEYIVTLWLSHDAYGEYTYVSQRLKVTIEPYTGDTVNGDDLSNIYRCFIDTLPWIDIIGCYKTLTYTLNIMSFGTFNFTGIFDWSFEPQCRQLQVLDEWIHVDNNNVCPAFSEEVRSTITPFVTLILGTIVITLIVRSVSPNNPHHFNKDV